MRFRSSALCLAAVVALAARPVTAHAQAPVRQPETAAPPCSLRSTPLRMANGYTPFTDVLFAARGPGQTLLAGNLTAALRGRREAHFFVGVTVDDGSMVARALGPARRVSAWPRPRAVVSDRRGGWQVLWLHADSTRGDSLGNQPYAVEVARVLGRRLIRQVRRDSVRLYASIRVDAHAEGMLLGEPASVHVGIRSPAPGRVQVVLIRLTGRGDVVIDSMPGTFVGDPVVTSLSVALADEHVVMTVAKRFGLSEVIEVVRWSARTRRWDSLDPIANMPMRLTQSRTTVGHGVVAFAWEGRSGPGPLYKRDSIWGSVRDPASGRWHHRHLITAPQPTLAAASFPEGSALLFIAGADTTQWPLLAHFADHKVSVRELTEQVIPGVARFQDYRGDTLGLWLIGPPPAPGSKAPVKRVLVPRRCFG